MEQVAKCFQLELFLSCKRLKNQIDFGKLDPFIELYQKLNTEEWLKVGNTEVIHDTIDPIFLVSIKIDYLFEENQHLRMKVFNSEDGEAHGNDWALIGTSECTLGQLVGSQGQTLNLEISPPSTASRRAGFLIIRCEQISQNNDIASLQLSGENIEDVSGFFSTFEPFFYLSRELENGERQRFYKSEYGEGTNVHWSPFEKEVKDLCHGDFHKKIWVDVYDYKSSGDHHYVATAEFTLDQVLTCGTRSFKLINPNKLQKKHYTDSGSIRVSMCDIIKAYSFIEYIRGGCQIELEVAIDFTGSNKHPSSTSSLHYISPDSLNHYQQALKAVSEILLNYCSDRQVPLYGFGGKINNVVSHCFSLSQNPDRPYACDLQGIMEMYKEALGFVGLSGPTLFAELLKKVVTDLEAKNINQRNQRYSILLILTDGEIHDMKETIDWVVRGSASPLSIVIVGIGNENFQNMQVLDADVTPLVDSEGNRMLRDIVQFVPFRDVGSSPYRLAKEVLDEIPREIVNYFKIRGIVPNTPTDIPIFTYSMSNIGEIADAMESYE